MGRQLTFLGPRRADFQRLQGWRRRIIGRTSKISEANKAKDLKNYHRGQERHGGYITREYVWLVTMNYKYLGWPLLRLVTILDTKDQDQ